MYILVCLLFCRQILQELLPANLIPVLEVEEWKQVILLQLSFMYHCQIIVIVVILIFTLIVSQCGY